MYVDNPRKKHHFFRKFLLSLLLVIVLFVGICCVIGQPKAEGSDGAALRRPGVSTILLAGTDEAGYRTDTIILMTVDSKQDAVSLLSIPRDTYTEGYAVPKINSACGAAGGGQAGMEQLMTEVTRLLGFRPDGYLMVNFSVAEKVVDIFGGLDFYVPMDMNYDDPYQDLYIHLQEGYQHLNGEQAVQVLRFRSGYAMADLERVNVQRDLLQAAIDQWMTPSVVLRGPAAAAAVLKETTTDLSLGNCIWLARVLMGCDTTQMVTTTLPGSAQYIGGGSYFVPDRAAVETLMQETYSPYEY